MILNRLKNEAIALGACTNFEGLDYKELAKLLFRPQGREFCEKHNFPSLSIFQQMKPNISEEMGVFVDCGDIKRVDDRNIALVGNTSAELEFRDNTVVHRVILMHGAEAIINASNYVVLLLVKIGDCKVVINKDSTVKVL